MKSLKVVVSLFMSIIFGMITHSVVSAAESPDGIKEGEIKVGELKRTFKYYVPSSYKDNKAIPLLLSYHGSGSDGAGQIFLTGYDKVAEKEGFIAIFPDSVVINAEGEIIPSGNHEYDPDSELTKAWNYGSSASGSPLAKVDDVAFTVELIDYFNENYNVDLTRVYSTGMSSGAFFSSHLVTSLPDRIAGIGLVTGLISKATEQIMPKNPTNVVMVMGKDDPLFNTTGPATVAYDALVDYWVGINKTVTEPVVSYLPQIAKDDPTKIRHEVYGGGKDSTEINYYLVENGGGHTWPGGPQYLSAERIGLASQHMNASEVIWDHLKTRSIVNAAESPNGIKEGEIKVGELKRTFKYYVPSSYKENKAVPIMLSYHGAGSDGAGQIFLTGYDKVAEKEGFIAIFPDSVVINADGEIIPAGDDEYDPDSELTKAWNSGGSASGSPLAKVDDVAFTAAIIDYFNESYNIDLTRVYATGMSSGAFFSSHLVNSLPNRIAGIGLVTGLMRSVNEQTTPSNPTKVVMVMGEDDPLFKTTGLATPAYEALVEYWIGVNKTVAEPVVSYLPQTAKDDPTKIRREVYSGGKYNTEIIYYLVENGGGHTWPGGPQYLPAERIGLASQHMNASEVIWDHLKTRTLADPLYIDVPKDHWAFTEIDYLTNQGVIRGYGNGLFGPNDQLTRGHAAVMFARAFDLDVANPTNPGLHDINTNHRYYNEIAAIVDAGIFTGSEDGKFHADRPLKRSEMAAVLVRAFDLSGESDKSFTDVNKSFWASDYINALIANGFTTGYPDGTFRPGEVTTRAQFSAFLYRGLN